MDSITQIALGAVIGQAIGHRKIGAKALVMGGLGGFIPDLDVLITPIARWMGHDSEFISWKYHRHFSHSVWFGPLLGSLMGWGLWRYYGRQAGHLVPWVAIMVLAILTHPLLDSCTIYGTQLLSPFSNHRFYISSVSIIDPIYTIPLFLAIGLFRLKKTRQWAGCTATTALIVTTLYLGFGWHLNNRAEEIATQQLAEQKVLYNKLESFTTIFQPWLRRVVVWQPDNLLRVGFVSTYAPSHIYWTCRQQVPDDLRQKILLTEPARMLDWFSVRHMAMFRDDNRITASDARYGVPGPSIFGWWGVDYRLEQNDTPLYTGRAAIDRDASWHAIGQLLRASYGLPNDFLPKEDRGC